MKNLLSKLKYAAITIPLILSLNFGKLQAQDKLSFGIKTKPYLEARISEDKFNSAITDFQLPDDYKKVFFQNYPEKMQTFNGNNLTKLEDYPPGSIGILNLEPYLKFKFLEVGLPIYIWGLNNGEALEDVKYGNAFSPLSVSSLKIERTPEVGLALGFDLSKNLSLDFEGTLSGYNLERTDYYLAWTNAKTSPDGYQTLPHRTETLNKGTATKTSVGISYKINPENTKFLSGRTKNYSLGVGFGVYQRRYPNDLNTSGFYLKLIGDLHPARSKTSDKFIKKSDYID